MENKYIIGEEKSLRDIIKDTDITSLLKSAVRAGASNARVENAEGDILYHHGSSKEGIFTTKKPVYLEGEIVGHIVVTGENDRQVLIEAIGELIFNALKIVMQSNYKALLATETHKSVVYQSYDELLETNRKLKLSEGKYRELAGSLEKQAQERTKELEQAHAKLLQQEKIASVGQLAAGVAHEINNPLGFILSNINTLNNYVSKFKDMLFLYRDTFEKNEINAGTGEKLKQKWEELKLDFISADIEELIKESLEGAERVKKIVSDLKGFSHIDDGSEADININEELNRTLNVLTHEISENTEIIRDYEDLPAFSCNPAQICQAFFSIIINALQAKKDGLKLTIATRRINNFIKINFFDNGPGIPENIRDRIFEPFFTTKEIGEGTGMGLNITYEIINSYGGTIEVESEPGEGTTFSIILPLVKEVNDVKVR